MAVICGGETMETNIDIVFCVDTSKDMAPFVSEFKENAHTTYKRFLKLYEDAGIGFTNLRVKIITFGDCTLEGDSICESKFFTLNDEKEHEEFNRYVHKIEVGCGGEEKRNSLDAWLRAMKSDWTKGTVRRHVIIMFTDAPAKPLAEKMNESLDESIVAIKKHWEEMNTRSKRFILYAPDCEPWTDIDAWDYSVFRTPTEVGAGCHHIDFDIMLRLTVNSI